MTRPELIETIPVGNILGEGVLWDSQSGTVWWTDIEASRLYHYNPENREIGHFETPERLGSFALTDKKDWFLAAFESGFARYNPVQGQVDWIARPEEDLSHTRFNDGRVDRQGRFWAGTMVEDDRSGITERGGLYRLDPDGVARPQLGDISISNSLCWSPDGSRMYFADSPSHLIEVFDFDPVQGRPFNRKAFAETPEGIHPDGSTVDREGFLWNAQWGGGKVVRYSSGGDIHLVLDLPVSQPTCVAFGGRDLSLLFVTTARADLTEEQLKTEPDAGHLLIYQTNVVGLEEVRVKLLP
ncbi:SMP-30/gluconolactonase/LRE family protein [Emcibacter sp.]|uniref:SMP-30/gluconolactonase/LRE family protein n=1 Tax=Emcibacter sp. TaxID=1979954 RepID=UPI003A900101